MNVTEAISRLQTTLAFLGHYAGAVDGLWGPKTEAAWQAFLLVLQGQPAAAPLPPVASGALAWGAKVSAQFRERIGNIADSLAMPPDGASMLMACMAWESGESFSPSVANMAGSGAVGLIQFMPATALSLGTTTATLARLTPEDQLEWVYKYFMPYDGKLKNLGDVYMAILWPAGVGKPDDWVLWDQALRPTTFRQNAGLDVNKDGKVTRAECIAKVGAKLDKGLQPPYVYVNP